MGRIGTFILGFILGGISVYASLHYHFVRADDGFHVVPKLSSTFAETYVDIRAFTLDDWNQHRELALALYQAEKTDLMQGLPIDLLRSAANQMFDLWDTPRP